VRPVGGRLQHLQHGRLRRGVQLRVVGLARLVVRREGQPLPPQGELRVHAGLVAARVLPVPRPVEPYGDQPVHHVEALVAQGRRDVLGPQQGGQRVGLGVADAGALLQDVGGPPGDARITGVLRVRDGVAYEFEGQPRIGIRVLRLLGEPCGHFPHARMVVIDCFVDRKIGGQVGVLLDQLHARRA
jgi:hypothetical protein